MQCGYGKAAYTAMVRNFAMNQQYLFWSDFKEAMRTHPTVLKRLAYIKRLNTLRESNKSSLEMQ